MTPRSPSPPLIKGIDGIVSRPPNEVNYSTLNGKMMKTGKPTRNRIQSDYKYGISGNMANYVKKEEIAGKNGYLIEPGDENKINKMKKDVGLDGEEGGDIREPQQQKCDKSETIASGENSNSKKTVITLQLLEE